MNQDSESKVWESWIFIIAGWLSGILFFLFSAAYFAIAYFQNGIYDYATGLIFLISGFISIPPLRRLVFKLLKRELTQYQVIYIILLLFLAAYGANYLAERQNRSSQTATTSAKPSAAPQKKQKRQTFIAQSGLYFGIIDSSGKWLIPARYDTLYKISEKRYWGRQNQEGYLISWGSLEGAPTSIKLEKILRITPNSGSSYFAAQSALGKWGVIDTMGKWLIPPNYDWLGVGTQKYYPYLRGAKGGLVSVKDSVPIHEKIEQLTSFSQGLALIQKNKKWGALDTQGRMVIAPRYDTLLPKQSGLMPALENQLWGYLNDTGAWAIEPRYKKVFPFFNELAAAYRPPKNWLIINKKGEEVILPEVQFVQEYQFGLLVASKNGKDWGIVSANKPNFWIIQPGNYNFRILSAEWVAFSENGYWGMYKINPSANKAELILKPKYDFIAN
jgi:hypothetical protein